MLPMFSSIIDPSVILEVLIWWQQNQNSGRQTSIINRMMETRPASNINWKWENFLKKLIVLTAELKITAKYSKNSYPHLLNRLGSPEHLSHAEMDWRKNSFFSFLLSLSEAYILPHTTWPHVHLHLLSSPALELAIQICTSDLSHDLSPPGLFCLLTLLSVWLTTPSKIKRGEASWGESPLCLGTAQGKGHMGYF